MFNYHNLSYRMAKLKSKVRRKRSALGKHGKAITPEHVDTLLRLAEQYIQAMILRHHNGFGANYIKMKFPLQ